METEPKSSTASEASQSNAGNAAPAWQAVSRGVALFLGSFSLLNLIGEARSPGFDANIWWIDLRPVPAPMARGLLALVGMLLVAYAVRPNMAAVWRRSAIAVVLLLFGTSLWNSVEYYNLIRQETIKSDVALPFSLHVAALLAVILVGLLLNPRRSSRAGRDLIVAVLTLAVCLIGFPLAQMYCFGKTDYRRPADAVVGFGCRALADGTPSDALADRVQTGCELYHAKLANKLIFSGGPGDGAVHETEAMRRLAIQLGVPAEDIILDPDGFNTQATVTNTARELNQRDFTHVLAVSHFYHLPRIKLCYHRVGIEVSTVPAENRHNVPVGYNLVREVAALWLYYLQPLAARQVGG